MENGAGTMIYTPSHIPISYVYTDESGIIHLVFKRAGKKEKEDLTLDHLLALIYRAVA